MTKKSLITCGLPYSNGNLHVGHIAGCYLPADIYVRYLRLKEKEVMFICGSDDHGVPIKLAADEQGKTPKEIATFYNKQQKKDFAGIGINFDTYGSTCDSEYHTQTSQEFFKILFDKGYFDKQSSKQFYDETSNMFLPDRYVKGTCGYCKSEDQNSDQCEECGKVLDVDNLDNAYSVLTKTPASIKETFHWYLDLTKFEDAVSNWLKTADARDHTRNFVKGLISSGLVKRSMTRDLDWGIPVPLDDEDAKDKVLYVWFDAPIGYISYTKQACQELEGNSENYKNWWKSKDTEITHFIGEDNTIFHCIIWIAMLSAEGTYQLPKSVVVNNYLNIKFPGKEEEKMSKSRGSAIWIKDYLANGGNPDTMRYYLTTVAPEKSRSVFSVEDMIQKNNSELGNALGNLVNRVLSFYKKHFGDEILLTETKVDEIDLAFENSRKEIVNHIASQLDSCNFKQAQDDLFDFIRSCNKYLDDKQPWSLRKTEPELAKAALINCMNAIYTIGSILSPFLPFTAEKIMKQLGVNETPKWKDSTKTLLNNHMLGETEILFTRIEKEEFI